MDAFYTIREVADKLHKSEQSVARWIKDGKLPYTQVSERRRLINEIDIKEFLDTRRIAPPTKRIDSAGVGNAVSTKRSLTTEKGRAETNVRIPKNDWRKELSRCQ